MVKLPNFEIEKYSKELKSHVNNCDKNLVNSNKVLSVYYTNADFDK